MVIKLVVAIAKDGGMGKDGRLPWSIPDDLVFFNHLTKTTTVPGGVNAVIMGRHTWESLPRRPLPSRVNIVISSSMNPSSQQVITVRSFKQAIEVAENITNIDTIFVIGGAKVYSEALLNPKCTECFVTYVKGDYDCDTYFPLQLLNDMTSHKSVIVTCTDFEISKITLKLARPEFS